jgi:hypothetical protein
MVKKKNRKQAELSEEEKVIGKRVDAMMDPRLPDPAPVKPGTVPPLDIFKDAPAEAAKTAKTAPEVSGKLLQKVDAGPPEAKPKPVRVPKTPKPEPQPEKQPEPQAANDPAKAQTTDLDDQATDQAVKDIASKEANTMLALQDAVGRKASHLAGNLAQKDRQAARKRKWAWFMLFMLAVVLLLLAVPYTPYTCRWPVGIRLRATTDILPSVCK